MSEIFVYNKALLKEWARVKSQQIDPHWGPWPVALFNDAEKVAQEAVKKFNLLND